MTDYNFFGLMTASLQRGPDHSAPEMIIISFRNGGIDVASKRPEPFSPRNSVPYQGMPQLKLGHPLSRARHDASGRRAHHKCSVDVRLCPIDFPFAACFETSAIGKSTSAIRLHSLGIMKSPQNCPLVPY